ncbi:MAG: S-methyl-5-thioribose-1-phosphate isomerase [Actinobacteria bacterium]|nr:S-methyl-5-thioribose-1-phosphate isomerase [Actinomycetota bacterium]
MTGNPTVPYPPTVEYVDGVVVLLDQAALPEAEQYVRCEDWQRVARAISDLEVRGAPAIGVAAAFGLALAADGSDAGSAAELLAELAGVADALIATRPTAVNLAWAVEVVVAEAQASGGGSADDVRRTVGNCAQRLAAEDLATCRAIGDAGAGLLVGVDEVITHCNAGALATVGYGTALGVIRSAHRDNPDLHVWADETRPVLQGARLTAFELGRDGIACTVIADGAAASVLRGAGVGAAIVGADRIAANGDVANKIGTYGLAVAARHHGVPFYVAAPLSTIDPDTPDGSVIEIEQRPAAEVAEYRGRAITPVGTAVHNPAFDVTPAYLVDAIITEVGVLRAPYGQAIAEALGR